VIKKASTKDFKEVSLDASLGLYFFQQIDWPLIGKLKVYLLQIKLAYV
jgi:hypothetical protein